MNTLPDVPTQLDYAAINAVLLVFPGESTPLTQSGHKREFGGPDGRSVLGRFSVVLEPFPKFDNRNDGLAVIQIDRATRDRFVQILLKL
jgi:hypothetical protein